MTSRQHRNTRSRPGTEVELQFINVVSTDQERKPTKAARRSLVRANAAHFHWRNNRPPQDKLKAKKSRHVAQLSLGAESSATIAVHGVGNETDQLQRSNHPLIKHDAVYDNIHPNFYPGSFMLPNTTQLGSYLVDPFSYYECELPRDFVSRCITFNARMILPALFPDRDATDNSDIRASWLQTSISNPCILHMFIMGAVLNPQGSLGVIPSSIAPVLFRSRAVSLIMGDPVEACKDINIFAIVALAKNGKSERVEVPPKTPKQGPLRSLQFLNSFGLTESVPVHLDGLSKLIELKGGLDKIAIPGLAAVISFGGIRFAVQHLTVPLFSFVPLSCPPKDFIFRYRGVGFGTDPDLYNIMSMLNSYTMMIDDFSEGRNVVAASVLIDHRNTTQHALLSLPPKTGSSECYRLAALIYNLLVIFPLPYVAAPFQRLVTQLKLALDEWDNDDGGMLLWVLAMGGIGAIGLGERDWFLLRFKEAAARTETRSWREARQIIKRGLWYEATNDGDGNDLWLDSQSI